MTTQQKKDFKRLIDEEILSFSAEIAKIKAAIYPKGAGTSDKVAHLNFKLDQSIHIQRHDEATKRLNRLKHAYLKIDTPEYGICQECEEEIALERLKLVPESRYCVGCMNELGL